MGGAKYEVTASLKKLVEIWAPQGRMLRARIKIFIGNRENGNGQNA